MVENQSFKCTKIVHYCLILQNHVLVEWKYLLQLASEQITP